MSDKVKLTGGPGNTATWIWLEDGVLSESTLNSWMEQYLKSCFGIKQWLRENGIDFRIEVEGWA